MLKTSYKVVLIIRFVSADEFNQFIPEIFILFLIHVTVVFFCIYSRQYSVSLWF